MFGGSNGFYIHNYHLNEVQVVKCSINSSAIVDCVGKWEIFDSDQWSVDQNMISLPCSDVCVENSNVEGNNGRYGYYQFDDVFRSNIYRGPISENRFRNAYYLYGAIDQSTNLYSWRVSTYHNESAHFNNYCELGTSLGNDYIFDILECSDAGKWRTESWENIYELSYPIDTDMLISACSSAKSKRIQAFSSLETNEESKICVYVNNSVDTSLNGEYNWLYYNSYVNGSIYYNALNDKFIYPYITTEGEYQYHIHSDYSNSISDMRCVPKQYNDIHLMQHNDIRYCMNRWEAYGNNSWFIDEDFVATPCQDICIENLDVWNVEKEDFVAVFTYDHFDDFRDAKSNVYFCEHCEVQNYQAPNGQTYDTLGAYLYGVKNIPIRFNSWMIGDEQIWQNRFNWGSFQAWSFCWEDQFPVGGYKDNRANYTFGRMDRCLATFPNAAPWKTTDVAARDGQYHGDENVRVYYCNEAISQDICVSVQPNSELYQTYDIYEDHEKFAVGFDLNLGSLQLGDILVMEYSCDDHNDTFNMAWDVLTLFEYQFELLDSSIENAIYKLPSSCDGTLFISIKFKVESVDNILSNNAVYIDNVYVYYNVDDALNFDDMNDPKTWTQNPDNSIIIRNDSSELSINQNNHFIYITKSIKTDDNGYHYKDFNLEFSLTTSGLSSGSSLTVEYQCDNNYLYVNDLCILKEYTSTMDCTDMDDSCSIQSYNLRSECDFSSEIVIKFELNSMQSDDSSFDDIVYIDYVLLTHSDISGTQETPLCRTLEPTYEPTQGPTTDEPTEQTTDQPVVLSAKAKGIDTTEMILIIVGAIVFFILLIIFSIFMYIKKRHENMKIKIRNAMVLLISIDEYENTSKTASSDVSELHLKDINTQKDMVELADAFTNELNYNVINHPSDKTNWKRDELIQLLKDKAKQFNDEVIKNDVDSLIVVISSFGESKCIYTSDGHRIDKSQIHRLFAVDYSESREKPRLFIFASYSVSNEARTKFEIQNEIADDEDAGKMLWLEGTKNPDHKLLQVDGIQDGNMMDDYNGNLVNNFTQKILNGDVSSKYIYEIFDEIEKDDANQTIKYTYNDRTRYICLQSNTLDKNERNVEMVGIMNETPHSANQIGSNSELTDQETNIQSTGE